MELGEKRNEEDDIFRGKMVLKKKKQRAFPLPFPGEVSKKKKIWGNDVNGGWDHSLLSPVKNVFLTFSFLQMSCTSGK